MVVTVHGDRPRPEVVLADTMIAVEPGSIAQTKIRIKYVGEQVAKFELSVVENCEAAAWTRIVPSEINQLRGDLSEVTVLFEPPRSVSVRAGKFPFGIRVLPRFADERFPIFPAVVEGDIAVGAINAVDINVVPVRPRARLRGRYRIDLENRGTEAVRAVVDATDGEDNRRLQFAIGRPTVTIQPGTTVSSFLRVRPDKILPLGQPVRHEFEVLAVKRGDDGDRTDGGDQLTEPGTFTQVPIISRWMIMAAILTAVILALVIAWRIANRPAELARPPDPPLLSFISTGTDAATLSVRESGQPADEAEVVIIDCDQLELEIRPPSENQSERVALEAGSQTVELTHDRGDAEQICAQARLIAGGVQSRWQETSAVVGASIIFGSAPPQFEDLGPNRIAVTWEPPSSEFPLTDLTFEVLINNVVVAPPVEGGGLRWEPASGVELPDGEVTVQVRATAPDGSTGLSETGTTSVRATEGVPAPSGVWLYFHHQPADGESTVDRESVQYVVQQLEGNEGLTRERLKWQIVGTEVRIPDGTTIGGLLPDTFPADGEFLHYADGYPTEDEALRACQAYLAAQAVAAAELGISIPACQIGRLQG